MNNYFKLKNCENQSRLFKGTNVQDCRSMFDNTNDFIYKNDYSINTVN